MSTTHIPGALRRQVRDRAEDRCEYCLIPESMTWAAHTIDHILAEKHGGPTEVDNLALACAPCNARKGSDLSSVDDETGLVTPLFHPRRDNWSDHFQLVGGRIEPLTSTGRVTTRLLHFNDPIRIQEGELLVAIGKIQVPRGRS